MAQRKLFGKRIIIFLGSLELGGAERQALLLARHLKNEQGAHVQIWGFHTPGRLARLCEQYGIPWRIEPIELMHHPIQKLVNLLRYANKLRNERVDVLLPYTVFPNVVCGLVWRLTGARICIWNQRDGGVERFGKKMEYLAVRNTPLFVSNSQLGADFLVKTLGINPKCLRVIQNGLALVDPEGTRAQWRVRLNVSEECLLVCMVANLSMYKDHVTLLDAWRNVIDQTALNGEVAVLLLAGRFDQNYEMLKELSVSLDLGETVRFLGQVDDLTGLLGAVDVGVFSSRLEGMPNGVLECMSMGLPVAATDIPGIRATVGQEGFEFLAPPGDAAVLADKILLFMRSPELRDRVGAANRRRIAEEFGSRQMCDQMTALIARYI
jgi:glycosyltransferase involved in cell wall biosynthesis